MNSRADQLRALGQSVWLDFIRRGHLHSGEFDQMVRDQGVVGVTSNPTIFQLAIAESQDYDESLTQLVREGLSTAEIFDRLVIEDIRMACDRLRPVFEQSVGLDGRVSIEVSPQLAADTAGTLAEARRLHRAVGRDNVMVKIPATAAGIPAIRDAIAGGICINVTLIFSIARYEEVMEAYLTGLERRVEQGLPIDRIFSVASFFVSRVDSKVDKAIETTAAALPAGDPQRAELEGLRGQAAVANARRAYARFRDVFGAPRFRALAAHGAHVQRPLWASTSTKNPAYRDVIYVEELIGRDTVNTLPPQTLLAFNDHGVVEERIGRDLEDARALFHRLPELGVPIDTLIGELEPEGVASFSKSFVSLLETLETRRRAMASERGGAPRIGAAEVAPAVEARLDGFEADSYVRRLWAQDETIWSPDPTHQKVAKNRLGWLDSPEQMTGQITALRAFAGQVANDGFTHALLLGMGGSSLAPETLARTFGVASRGLHLTVLDSTSPAAVRAVMASHDPAKTLVIVASKSGGTLEVTSFEKHFFEWVKAVRGAEAGRSFIAITDPDTALGKLAGLRGYRRVFVNPPDIGGRYSALSYFGLVPAALLGVDLASLLEHAVDEAKASGPAIRAHDNFAVRLGAVLGELALAGRDKLTLALGSEFEPLGPWIEQLVAESTGKEGRGILPVEGEPLGGPEVYGRDRVFVSLSVDEPPRDVGARLDALESAGHPVLRWRDPELAAIGAEFLRWEIATATAGLTLGIDPFDEPNVAEAKQATQAAIERFVRDGHFPQRTSVASAGTIVAEAPERVSKPLAGRVNGAGDPAAWTAALLTLAEPGDYFAILAYLNRTAARTERLDKLRLAARNASRLATTVGYGPRFLHSTGQLHKGGPDTGIFLLLTEDEGEDVPIPGEPYGFSALIRAQAFGDYEVLERRGRRVLHVHLGADVEKALDEMVAAVAAVKV